VILNDRQVKELEHNNYLRINRHDAEDSIYLKDIIQTLRAAWSECDDYRTVLRAIERGSFSYRNGNLIARDVLAKYAKEEV
jgi:hypothetical protein